MIFESQTFSRHITLTPGQSANAAMNALLAQPWVSTAIWFEPGEYLENIRVPSTLPSSKDAPIALISKIHLGAIVRPPDQTTGAISAWNVDGVIIAGFTTIGGYRGIFIGADVFGRDQLVLMNKCQSTPEDGIKISHQYNVDTIGNICLNNAEEGIDYLGVIGGLIEYNEVANTTGTAAGIFTKGSSQNILVSKNYVHNIPNGNGIVLGGSTGIGSFPPSLLDPSGHPIYEAADCKAEGNIVSLCGKVTIQLRAAQRCNVIGNLLQGTPGYYANVAIRESTVTGHPTMYCKDDVIDGNKLDDNTKIVVHNPIGTDTVGNQNIVIGLNPYVDGLVSQAVIDSWRNAQAAIAYPASWAGPVVEEPPPPPPPPPPNSAPVIVTATATGRVTEWKHPSIEEKTNKPHIVSGSITFSDADAADTHTAAVSPQATGYLGSMALDVTKIGEKQVRWTFTVLDTAINSMGAGVTKTQKYNVAITDNHGGSVVQVITITIVGAKN